MFSFDLLYMYIKTYTLLNIQKGIDSELVSLENIVSRASDDDSGRSAAAGHETEGLGQDFYDKVANLLRERLRECGNRVPVVTGH